MVDNRKLVISQDELNGALDAEIIQALIDEKL